MTKDIELRIDSTTHDTSRTQNQSCTSQQKCAVSFIIIGLTIIIILAVIVVILLFPILPTNLQTEEVPLEPYDDYEEYYKKENIIYNRNLGNGGDYDDETQQAGGITTPAKITDVSSKNSAIPERPMRIQGVPTSFR